MNKLSLVILLLGSTCLFQQCSESDPAPVEENTDYELYSLFMENFDYETLVVHAESYYSLGRFTMSDSRLEYALDDNPELDRGLIARLKVADEDSLIFENKFSSEAEVIIVPREDIIEIFNQGSFQESWAAFFNVYGESSVRLSLTRIAYNDEKDEAVFGAGKARFGDDYGYIVHLAKTGDQWEILKITITWVS